MPALLYAMAHPAGLFKGLPADQLYHAVFMDLWAKYGDDKGIAVRDVPAFAADMVSRGKTEWNLSDEDLAPLAAFAPKVPPIAFLRFDKGGAFDTKPFLSDYSDFLITISSTPIQRINPHGEPVNSVKYETSHPVALVINDTTLPLDEVVGKSVVLRVALLNGKIYLFHHKLFFCETQQTYSLRQAEQVADDGEVQLTPSHGEWLQQGGTRSIATKLDVKGIAPYTVVDWSSASRGEDMLGALKKDGYVLLKNHGVADHLIEKTMDRSDEFFNLKMRWALRARERMPMMKCARGFTPMYDESLNPFLKGDTKESFDYGLPLTPSIAAHLGPNYFPSDTTPGFEEDCMAYIEATHALGVQVVKAIAEGLGAGSLDHLFEDPLVVNRLLRYPPLPPTAEHMGAGSHVDYGAVTLITQDSPGVEVLHNDEWHVIPAVFGTLLVMTGFMLEKITNGLLPATKHRVVNRNPSVRRSIATFIDPNPGQGRPSPSIR
eukprot:Sspe_Gene.65004::Locus_38499_Transcript_1_2_Confidence_0.667_Length_1742::g.65004::m.65004